MLRHAKEKGLRHSDAAIELGLVTREDRQDSRLQLDYPYLVPRELRPPEVIAARPFSRQVEASGLYAASSSYGGLVIIPTVAGWRF